MGNRSSAVLAPDAVATTPKPKPKPKRTIKKRKVHYTVDNPSVHEMVASVQEFSQVHPYGRCTICDAITHSTIDHDAPLVRKHMWKQARKQTRSLTRKHKHKFRGVPVSPFICLDEGMRGVFVEDAFDRAWDRVTGCINAVHQANPEMFYTRDGVHVIMDDGVPRVYRDDWDGCCPPEVKAIAHDMATEFMTKGVTMRHAVMTVEPLYNTICYAVVSIYLDEAEWDDLHKSHAFEQCLDDESMHGVKTHGERLVRAIIANEPICKRMRLGGYLTRIVGAVWDEGDEGDDEGDEGDDEGDDEGEE